ncbi:MAG: ABC transporter permease [Silicimonas sp.]|nr:ABC transporter permease [Silicimonas sp.]NND19301.1 ABC transporter permease [Silicimonas sp.]NNL36617.1 ABC transporter permease [Silicimonas sp.]RZW05611.1 MAG: ABC transporter permease [Paracoccaceae bacterium]
MFETERKQSLAGAAMTIGDLIYHNTVRTVRKTHRDAIFAILVNIMQTLIMVGAFVLLFEVLGMRGTAIRGDFLLYVMSGIFVFMVHIKALTAVATAEGPSSPMMQHLPMSTTVSIWAAAFSALYIQVISLGAILFAYHLIWTPIEIHQPVGAASMLVLAWFFGVAVGTIFLALKPWIPGPVGIAQQIYTRVNMFASGKMFVANMLPGTMVLWFAWNPLFHIIDQGRGYIFINYNPMKTSLMYPIYISVILLVIGLIGESFTRKRVSLSWGAAR